MKYTVNKLPNYTLEISHILEDPAASPWLRRALREALENDPADALIQAEELVCLLEDRLVSEALQATPELRLSERGH